MNKNILIIGVLMLALAGSIFLFTQQKNSAKQNQKGEFSTSIFGLPTAKSQETVELKNGDSYNLTAVL